MKKTSYPIRLGVVGTNFISDWLIEASRLTHSCEAAAVYSRSMERADEFADKHGIRLRFDDFAALVACEDVDAIYIASPNALHYPQAMEALKNGKHVLCEKPLATNEKHALEMSGLAKAGGLVLMEAIRPMFDPFLDAVKANLPRLGRICRATFEFCQYSSRYGRFKAGEYVGIFDPKLGNAALMDLGVYCMHCCAAIFGEPKRIYAAASFLPNGVEAAGTALLDYGEIQAEIAYSKITHSVFPSIIQGENGSLTIGTLNAPSHVTFVRRDGQNEDIAFEKSPNNMVFELDAFARCVNGEQSPDAYLMQSIMVLRVFDEIRRQSGVCFD